MIFDISGHQKEDWGDYMIRVIIVEDERVIRNGIKKHVSWEELGVDEVKTAENADEAFVMSKEYKPDIIISDIRMPGMNGIEFCTKCKELFPDSQIIFMSGFSDKEYLMAGISLGAVSYVEKPINIDELSKAVEKAVNIVLRTKRQNSNVLHSLIWTSDSTPEDILNRLTYLESGRNLRQDNVFFISILESKEEISDVLGFHTQCNEWLEKMNPNKKLHLITDSIGTHQLLLLVSAKETDMEFDDAFMIAFCQLTLSIKDKEQSFFIGTGTQVDSIKKIKESYENALLSLQALSYKGWNQYALFSEERNELTYMMEEDSKNRFYKLLFDKKEKEVFQVLDEIEQMLVKKQAVLNFHVRNIYFTLDNMVKQVDKAHHLDGFNQEEVVNARFLDEAKTISEMKEYVCKHVVEVLEETEEDKKNTYIVKRLMEYINQNLSNKELCIQSMADEVYLTPTYLSSLFKKKTGITIGQYLTDVRMKKAEEILINPKLKLYQVAELVGYEDANYFAKIFKKKTGMLPSEYREMK